MNRQKIHQLIDWCVILIFVVIIIGTTATYSLWEKSFFIAPVCIFFALCLLLLNHISLKDCFRTKNKEFFLMSGGVVLSSINILLINSRIGAFFTIADFLLIIYLADKVHFNKIQIGVIAFTSFSIWFYWQFISTADYFNSPLNPNGVSIILLSNFSVFVCYFTYLLSLRIQLSKWIYYSIMLLLIIFLAKRTFAFHSRGALLGVIAWAVTFYILPKKNFTIPLILGFSLLIPALYVLLWKSGIAESATFFGKRINSGREIIWYQFFMAFINHPITGIGSDFDRMVPDLYLKEIHHSLLDLLFVHGIPVFLLVLYFLYKRIQEIINVSSGFLRTVCLSSIYGMITVGTFENYYIVPPHNILFLMIFIIFQAFVQEQASKESSF